MAVSESVWNGFLISVLYSWTSEHTLPVALYFAAISFTYIHSNTSILSYLSFLIYIILPSVRLCARCEQLWIFGLPFHIIDVEWQTFLYIPCCFGVSVLVYFETLVLCHGCCPVWRSVTHPTPRGCVIYTHTAF